MSPSARCQPLRMTSLGATAQAGASPVHSCRSAPGMHFLPWTLSPLPAACPHCPSGRAVRCELHFLLNSSTELFSMDDHFFTKSAAPATTTVTLTTKGNHGSNA